MFQRTPRTHRGRWLLVGLALAAAVLIALNTPLLEPARNVSAGLTLPLQEVLSQAGNTVRGAFGGVGDIAVLRNRNRELEQLVAGLTIENLRLQEVEAENERLRQLLEFSDANPMYDYKGGQVIGRVVGSEPGNVVQSILIDLGKKDGIEPGMAVVTERGLVGRIDDVYSSMARVLLITDSNSSVNSMLQNTRMRGIVHGRAGLPALLDYLPPDEPVLVGDIVITSGEGGVLPAGIPIGQVLEVEQNDVEMFQRAVVRTTVDFNSLETVLVVTNFVPVPEIEYLPERP
jgi:rod shape-determining protein MreC